MEMRYRVSLTGKMILQVLEGTKNGIVWRDATFQDFQQMIAENMEAGEEGEDKTMGFGAN